MVIKYFKDNSLYHFLFHKSALTKRNIPINNDDLDIPQETDTIIFISLSENADTDLENLHKILNACKLAKESFTLFTEPVEWATLRRFTFVKNVLLFGINEEKLNLNIHLPLNLPLKFDNRWWIKSLPIRDIFNDQKAKNDLWINALKPHFMQ